MNDRSELDRFELFFEAPSRGEELEHTINQRLKSIREGLKRIIPLMPHFGKRRKR